MTTRVLASNVMTTSVTTVHFFTEIMSTLLAIKSSFKKSYDKQNITRVVKGLFDKFHNEMTTRVISSTCMYHSLVLLLTIIQKAVVLLLLFVFQMSKSNSTESNRIQMKVVLMSTLNHLGKLVYIVRSFRIHLS